jgi:membrane fusion protein (multidrug efflux system)
MNLAKSNWDRWQQLADRGIAPAATAEQYKSQYEQAVANLRASQARAGDREIRAPFSGTVGLTDAAPGMLVNPGAAIATLDDLSVIRVDFPVPERFVSVLRDGLPISATADAYPDRTFQGRIAKLDTRVDPATRSVTARAEFPNPDGRLKPGMLLHVTIDRATRQSAAVPESAVVFESGDAYVLVLQRAPAGQGGQAQGQRQGPPAGARQGGASGPGANGGPGGRGGGFIAVRQDIQAGIRQDGFVEVLAGLSPGQRIVGDGTNRVRPNDPVSIAGFQGGLDPQATMAQADKNKDGSISREEWLAAGRPEAFFERVDANKDGKVTAAELQAQRARAPGGAGRAG